MNAGGQAFPLPLPGNKGMTLRDYFAAAALQHMVHHRDTEFGAQWAYRVADAMIKERDK